jgi:hypothetical protein
MIKLVKKFLLCVVVLIVTWGDNAPHVTISDAAMNYIIKRSQPLTASGIFNDADGNAMDYSVWVYGVSLYANVANSQVNIKDCDTIAELNNATELAIDEIGQPTQFETSEHSFIEMFGRPLYFEDGVGGSISTGGVVFITYGEKP